MDAYSNDDMFNAALVIHRKNVEFGFEYDVKTAEEYAASEQVLKALRTQYNTVAPTRLRRALLKWIAYEEHNLRGVGKNFKKINGEWTSASQRSSNLQKCLGL
jgi:hypothetical protein